MKKVKRIFAVLLVAAVLACCLAACGDAPDKKKTVKIAMQYGMQYAPVCVMQELGLLQKQLGDEYEIEWLSLGGGSAMNEALISNSLDVAFMGIPPVLIAADAGASYKIACGICVPPAELLVGENSGIESISDITAQTKIAVPSIGSIQHIMLAMAAEKTLGNSNALDSALVPMANPDAYTALLSGTDVVGHFASMPYIALERDDGCKSILTAADCLGSGASIVCVATEKVYKDEALYNAVLTALAEAIDLINAGDDDAVSAIAAREKLDDATAREYLTWAGTLYTTDIYNLTALGEFMERTGFIKSFGGFAAVTYEGAKEING